MSVVTMDAELGDEELVAQARRDPARFALLYRRYATNIYQYCDRCLGSRETAEDATQTIFLHALASLGSCRDGKAFRSWLFAIAHNEIVSRRRSRRVYAHWEDLSELPDQEDSPEELALAAVERREITALLAHLPPDLRHPVELRLQGLSGREIAQILGRSEGAIRMAHHRAKHLLASMLSPGASKDTSHVAK
jgi:RNA polymerase sigma-70 factor (ECF subfamily)